MDRVYQSGSNYIAKKAEAGHVSPQADHECLRSRERQIRAHQPALRPNSNAPDRCDLRSPPRERIVHSYSRSDDRELALQPILILHRSFGIPENRDNCRYTAVSEVFMSDSPSGSAEDRHSRRSPVGRSFLATSRPSAGSTTSSRSRFSTSIARTPSCRRSRHGRQRRRAERVRRVEGVLLFFFCREVGRSGGCMLARSRDLVL